MYCTMELGKYHDGLHQHVVEACQLDSQFPFMELVSVPCAWSAFYKEVKICVYSLPDILKQTLLFILLYWNEAQLFSLSELDSSCFPFLFYFFCFGDPGKGKLWYYSIPFSACKGKLVPINRNSCNTATVYRRVLSVYRSWVVTNDDS